VQRELVEAILAIGTPVVLVLVTGHPYAMSWALDQCAALIQAFVPGEEGAAAIAGVISGGVNPSGRLPVTLPRSAGGQPYSYLHPLLGGPTTVSNLPTAPALPFRARVALHTFEHKDLAIAGNVAAGGAFAATMRVTNTGLRARSEVVQLYDITSSRRSADRRRSCSATPGSHSNRVSRLSCGSSSRRPGLGSRIGIWCAWLSRAMLSSGSVPFARRAKLRRVFGLPAKPDVVTPGGPRWTVSELLPA
jgi:hypothetical protein